MIADHSTTYCHGKVFESKKKSSKIRMRFKRVQQPQQKNLFFSEQQNPFLQQPQQQIDFEHNTQPITSSFILQENDYMDEGSAIDPILSDNIFDLGDDSATPIMESNSGEILDEKTQTSSPLFPQDSMLSPSILQDDSIFPEPSPSPKKPNKIIGVDTSLTSSFTGRFNKLLLESKQNPLKQSSSNISSKIQKPQKTKLKYKPTNLQIKSIFEYSENENKPVLGAGLIHNDFDNMAISQNQNQSALSQPKTSTQDFEITCSGNFAMGGIKIGASGIIDFGQMTLTQSQTSANSLPLGYMNYFTSQPSTGSYSQTGFHSQKDNADSQIISFDTLELKRPKLNIAVGGTPNKSPMKATVRKTKSSLPTKHEVQLEDLEVVKSLGTGASSVVLLVRNKFTGDEYAKKVLSVQESAKPKWITAEIQSLYKLRKCPYVLTLYDAYYLDNKIQLLMEKMDGSLEDFVKKNKPTARNIPESVLACISLQILRGLHYLHTYAGGVHRDIKPANILYNKSGQVKISDFGLTGLKSTKQKQLSAPQDGKQFGLSNRMVFETCQGTLLYMSPERIQEKEHDSSSDIWSFGVTLLELALGDFPWKVNMFEILLDAENLTRVKQFSHKLSAQLIDFLERMLKMNPNERATAERLLNHPFITSINQNRPSIVDKSVLETTNELVYEISKNKIRQWLESPL